MARLERPPGPIGAGWLRLRRAFGRTAPGRVLRRMLGREIRIPILTEPDREQLLDVLTEEELDAVELERTRPRSRPQRLLRHPAQVRAASPITNVLFVSHCNFRGNSAFHVHAIASELHRRGLSPVIAVPDEPETVEDIGRPPFPVLTYDEVRAGGLAFPNGSGPDLVHAFTPRELVRLLTVDVVKRHGCRYVVHLEDNEETVLAAEHGGVSIDALKALPVTILDRIVRPRQAHPLRTLRFLERSAGITVLVERLLEFVPEDVPARVVHAGFDDAVLSPARQRDAVRGELALEPTDLAIVYPGNIHMVNIDEMRELWTAVAQLRRAGHRIVLVKTGWGSTQTVAFPSLGDGLRDLGWVPHERVPELLAAADVLVQPGGPGPFNDYRFPSKLPEFLASGRPVVLPRTNVGLLLRDGEEALLLERGDASEIAAAVERLAGDPALRQRIGEAGRAFALRELRWSTAVDRVQELYDDVRKRAKALPPAWALDGVDPPVRVIALVPAAPTSEEAETARRHAVYGFCLEPGALGDSQRGFRYCVHDADGVHSVPEDDPLAIRFGTDDVRLAPLETCAAAKGVYPCIASTATGYSVSLSKLVLRALLLAGVEQPVVFVDGRHAWVDADLRSAWLADTRAGLREGIRHYYGSRGLNLSEIELDRLAATS